MVISTISTYYTDASKSPLSCEKTTPGEGWLEYLVGRASVPA
jgi:hypothetical protein